MFLFEFNLNILQTTKKVLSLISYGEITFFLFLAGFNISTVSPVPGQVGHNVTLICNVTATYPPVASVTWEFNGARIETQSIERFNGGSVSSPSLFITNLQNTDEGNYTCIVSNLYSSDSAVVSLDIVSFGKRYWSFIVYHK